MFTFNVKRKLFFLLFVLLLFFRGCSSSIIHNFRTFLFLLLNLSLSVSSFSTTSCIIFFSKWYKYPNEVLSHQFHTSIIFLSLHYYSVSIEICGSTPFSQNIKSRYFLVYHIQCEIVRLVCLGLRVYVLGSIHF